MADTYHVMQSGPLPAALALLIEERSAAAENAIVRALADLEPAAQSAALSTLARWGDASALLGVVGRFTDFSEELQRLIVEHVHGLYPAIRRAITSSTLTERFGAIELIARSRNATNAYLLANAVRSGCPQTKRAAAIALQSMTEDLVGCGDDGRSTGSRTRSTQMSCLAEALGSALGGWEIHFRPEIIEAALRMGDRVEGAVRKKLQEPRTKIARIFAERLERAAHASLAGFVLRALAIHELRGSAVRAISRGENKDFIRALLSETWLLADPRIERGCRRIRSLRWAGDRFDELGALDESQVAGAVRLVRAMGGSHERKIACFRGWIQAGDERLRRAVVWALAADAHEAATDLLDVIAGRRDDVLAGLAARRLRRRPVTGRAMYTSATSAPVERVTWARGGRGSCRAHATFEAAWRRHDDLPAHHAEAWEGEPPGEPVVGNALVGLRAKLSGARSLDRLQALRRIRDGGLARELLEEIYRAAHDPDPSVRGLAVAMLAELPGATTVRILRAAVNDPEERVQANAIEGLDLLDVDDRVGCTEPKLASPNSRVRANAVKSLLRLDRRQAGDTLLEMLDHRSRAHRLSALWVIERLRLKAATQRVIDLGREDADTRVRRRARRVLSALTGDPDASKPMPVKPFEQARGDAS